MSARDHIKNQVLDAQRNFSSFFTDLRTEAYANRDKYTEEDIRCGLFVILSQDVLWLLLLLEEFLQVIDEKSNVTELSTLDAIPRLQFLTSYNQISRMSFLTKFMFGVEDFLKSLMRATNNTFDDGYYKMTQNILNFLDLNDTQNHKILNAPAQIRNSLHNGGFASYDFEITIKDKTFKFIRGQKIDFANWNTIYMIVDELINLIKIIIKNKKISKINIISSNYEKVWKFSSLTTSSKID